MLGGASVTLLEARDSLGGSVSHHVVGGIVLDAGAESFATRGGTVAALATKLGLADEIVQPTDRGAWLHRANGDAVPIPELTLLGIPGSPMAADVAAILGRRNATRAFLESLLPGVVGANATSLGELVRRRMGSAVVDELVAPIAGGVHSEHPDQLDVDRVAPGLRAALRRTGSLARAVQSLRTERAGAAVAGIRGGVHRITDELVADLDRFGVDVRLGTRVESVSDGGVLVAGETVEGHVIVAAPGLLGDAADPGRRVVLATLVLDDPRLDAAPRGSGVLVAKSAPGIRARALTHATAKWEWLAERAEGKHVVRLSYDDHVDVGTAVADASALLGLQLRTEDVVDFATVEWLRPRKREYSVEGISVVGEVAAGTGIANITAHAEALGMELLQDTDS